MLAGIIENKLGPPRQGFCRAAWLGLGSHSLGWRSAEEMPILQGFQLRTSICRDGLGGLGGFVNSTWSGLDPSTPSSPQRCVGLGALLRGREKALLY